MFFFNVEGVFLALKGCTCVLRGCSRTLKTPNSPPLLGMASLLIGPTQRSNLRPPLELQCAMPNGIKD